MQKSETQWLLAFWNKIQTQKSFFFHSSSFLTVCLLFKWRFVAWQRGFPRKFAYCVSVLNKRSFNSACTESVSPQNVEVEHCREEESRLIHNNSSVRMFSEWELSDRYLDWLTLTVALIVTCACESELNVPACHRLLSVTVFDLFSFALVMYTPCDLTY